MYWPSVNGARFSPFKFESKNCGVARLGRARVQGFQNGPLFPTQLGFVCPFPPQQWAPVHCTPCTSYCCTSGKNIRMWSVSAWPNSWRHQLLAFMYLLFMYLSEENLVCCTELESDHNWNITSTLLWKQFNIHDKIDIKTWTGEIRNEIFFTRISI